MTREEWDKVVALMAATWPHSPPEDATINAAYVELSDLSADQVFTAVRTFNREGDRFPPTSGQIRQRVTALTVDSLDYGEAWRLATKAARKVEPRVAEAWLGAQSPEALRAVRELTGGSGVLSYMTADEATVRAQFRDIYRAVCQRARREVEFAGLPAAGLPALERGTAPRKIDLALVAGQKHLEKGTDGGQRTARRSDADAAQARDPEG